MTPGNTEDSDAGRRGVGDSDAGDRGVGDRDVGDRGVGGIRTRMRRALTAAMKARDQPAVTALRSALAAIDNAEAVDTTEAVDTDGEGHPPGEGRIAGAILGVGAAEVARRTLTPAEVQAIVRIVRQEVAERQTAARAYARAGQSGPAERLRAEAEVLRAYLDDPEGDLGDPGAELDDPEGDLGEPGAELDGPDGGLGEPGAELDGPDGEPGGRGAEPGHRLVHRPLASATGAAGQRGNRVSSASGPGSL